MILKRYINGEILKSSLAILVVLVLLFVSTRFIKYIQYAVDGTISSSSVLYLMSLQIPSVAGFLLPMSFFIGYLTTLGRMYAENEMAVIHGVGVSDFQLAKNSISLALGLALVSGGLSFWLNPWANFEVKRVMAEESAQAKLGGFSAGTFKQSSDKDSVVFVESRTSEGEIQRLFSVTGLSEAAENIEIQLAEKGKIQQIGDAETSAQLSDSDFLVLQNGVNYQFSKQGEKWHKTEYESYFMRFEDEEELEFSVRTKGISSIELLRIGDLKSWAELHWRLSAPISILILCFLAVPLAKTQPRKGKFSRLFPAIMIYMVYALLLMNGKQLLESGRIPQPLGFWWIHLIAATFCFWTYRSNNNRNKKRKRLSIAANKGKADV